MTAIPQSNNEDVTKSGREKESTDQNVDKSKRGEEGETQARARGSRELGQNERNKRETKNGTQIETTSDESVIQ